MNNKILIIGKIPPPTGGVTIHVSRILETLRHENIDFKFEELSYKNLCKIFLKILFFYNIHLHSNNSYLQFFYSLFTKILFKNSILTIHAEIGQHNNSFYNFLESLAIRLVKYPITLNKKSHNIAIKYNINSILDSAYILPKISSKLPIELEKKVLFLRNTYKKIFCTNAYNRVFDKLGNELYGIDDLIKLFNGSNYFLFVCDPSGSYFNYYKDHKLINIYFVNYHIDFISLLHHVDGFIRNTTSDGDSISIHEALHLDKLVFCTNVVDRPDNVILYDSAIDDLPKLLKIEFKNKNYISKNNKVFDLYKELIN